MNKGKPSRQRTDMDVQETESSPVVKLGPDIKAKIGQQLRLMYGEVVNQGVPDRFVDILRGLDDQTDEGSKNEPS
jgi:anti-sigma factor NepR-like protein